VAAKVGTVALVAAAAAAAAAAAEVVVKVEGWRDRPLVAIHHPVLKNVRNSKDYMYTCPARVQPLQSGERATQPAPTVEAASPSFS